MYRGTTPEIELKIDSDLVLSTADDIVITFRNLIFKQDGPTFSIKLADERFDISDADKKITVVLTQQETLELKPGKLEIQARLRFEKKVYATDIVEVEVKDILGSGVLK